MQREGKGSRHLREELPGRVSSYPEPGGCAQKAAEAVRQRKPCFWGRSLDFILSAMGSQSRQATESDFFFVFKCLNTPLGMRDLSSQPGIEPMSPAVEAQTPNSCTAREVLISIFKRWVWPLCGKWVVVGSDWKHVGGTPAAAKVSKDDGLD